MSWRFLRDTVDARTLNHRIINRNFRWISISTEKTFNFKFNQNDSFREKVSFCYNIQNSFISYTIVENLKEIIYPILKQILIIIIDIFEKSFGRENLIIRPTI